MEAVPLSNIADLAAELAALLISRHETAAVAECSTGGLVSHLLTDLPGSSAWFVGGAVTYSRMAKDRLAGVGAELVAKHGAVSPEVALALAGGIRRQLGADWGLGETGITGPQQSRRSAKTVGLTCLAVVGSSDGQSVERATTYVSAATDRPGHKRAFAEALLRLAIDTVRSRS